MSENQKNGSPVFRIDINGAVVTIRFSDTETADVKARVRDILTESYEDTASRSGAPRRGSSGLTTMWTN